MNPKEPVPVLSDAEAWMIGIGIIVLGILVFALYAIG